MPDETRVLRDRLASLGDAFDNAQGGGEAYGSSAMLAQTTTVTTYPTVAAAMYAVVPCDADGVESEGNAVAYVPRTGSIAYAVNLGTTIPPSGTRVVCHAVGGRWAFRYDS